VNPTVILVTDPAFGDDGIVACVEAVGRALPKGALCVQLRDKQRPVVSLRLFGSRLRLLTRTLGAMLVINGDARLARDVGADGVHLGKGAGTVAAARNVMPQAWVSVSAHSDGAVRRALTYGADAVLVSPVFPSRPPSVYAAAKEGRGMEALAKARTIVELGHDTWASARHLAGASMKVYALGGVDADNAGSCARAGADGVAVVRALLANPEPGRAARAMHDAVARH
jgi:thiamine-phosphate pyrophosphorylase